VKSESVRALQLDEPTPGSGVNADRERNGLMFDLEALLAPEHVLPRLRARCRREAFRAMAEAVSPAAGAPCQTILDALLEREKLGSTALGGGVAVPHARLDTLDGMMGCIARLDPPVDFEAIDGQPVDLVFMLLAPEHAGSAHLRALAKVARVFRERQVVAGLRGAADADAIYAVLAEHQASHAA